MRDGKCEASGRAFRPGEPFPVVKLSMDGVLFTVDNSLEGARNLFDNFGFGRVIRNALVLSPCEAVFISMINRESVEDFDVQSVWKLCSQLYPEGRFARIYSVYHYYRCGLWIVRDGSVYGADFVLYPDHPDLAHSKYLVKIFDNWENIDREGVLASRVGWGVKKATLFVKVSVPEGADFSDVDCIKTFQLENMSIKRLKFK
jgi:tRNA-intron lyase